MSSRKSVKSITGLLTIFTMGNVDHRALESLKKVKIDSYLISLGLISEQSVNTTFGQSFWKRSHQLFVYLLEWFMLSKWLIVGQMSDNYLKPSVTGDFTVYLSGESFNYHYILFLWSAIGAISCTLFYMARNDPKINLLWLKPFELCKGKLKYTEMDMELEEASHFWQRVIHTLWLSKTLARIAFVITAAAYCYVMAYICPKEHLNNRTYFWIVVTIVWLYYNNSILFGVMAVFHMICYYFVVKFQRLNEIVEELETNKKIDMKTMHERIGHYMTYHNNYVKELSAYNHFWQYYLLMALIIFVTIVCFQIQLILFLRIDGWVQALIAINTILFAIFLLFVGFSASAVSNEIHESYGTLNAISQYNLPLVLKTQLQIYIQRIGGPTMGFSCWDLFTITYEAFFQSLLMVGSFFLLFMDVSQSEKKKKSPISGSIDSVRIT